MKHWIAVTLLLLAGVILSLTSMVKKSPTFDEVAHIGAGYSYIATDDYRMNVEHPPLVKKLAGWGMAHLHPQLHPEEEWQSSSPWTQWTLGQKFLYQWNSNPDQLVFWARLPVVFLFVLLGVLIYCCAREFYGPQAGLTALTLYIFTPDFLAHGQLVTTDLAITLFMFAGIYFFYRNLRSFSWKDAIFFALSLGLAAIVKFSAILLFLLILLLAAAYLADRNNTLLALPENNPGPRRFSRPQTIAILTGLALATTWALIWAAYGFRFALTPDASAVFDWENFKDHGLITRLADLNQQWHFLPDAYLGGFITLLELLGGRAPYFYGQYSFDNWWYYYPATFLLKTPLPLILLIGLGIFRRRQGTWQRRETVFLLLPAGIYLAIAIFSKVSVGHRHILPIYPFLIVWAAEIGQQFDSWRLDLKKSLVALLLGWQVLGTLLLYPNFLTFFNELVGGPRNGHRFLIDSNLDWGQDLIGLAEYREKHAAEKFYVSYYGTADPRYYLRNVNYLPCYLEITDVPTFNLTDVPPGAYVAISATILMSTDLATDDPNGTIAKKLQEIEPIARIGNSIYIYRRP